MSFTPPAGTIEIGGIVARVAADVQPTYTDLTIWFAEGPRVDLRAVVGGTVLLRFSDSGPLAADGADEAYAQPVEWNPPPGRARSGGV